MMTLNDELELDTFIADEVLAVEETELDLAEILHSEVISISATEEDTPDGRTPLQQYMKELSGSALLSAEEEIKYSRAMKKGDARARNILIESNLRLVIKIARSYLHRGLAFDDLVSEGNCGLMHSIEKFDPDKGFRISTYSAIWIREYIERAIMNTGRTIRLPVHMIKEMNRYIKAGEAIAKETGRKATEQEIAKAVKKPVEKVREVLGYYKDATSLNIVVSHNSNKELEDLLPDQSIEKPDHNIQETTVNEKLNRVFLKLDSQEQEVIRRRFALGSNEDYQTLEAVSEAMGLTKEIVRRVQLKALSKLKTYLDQEGLRMEDVF